jgi:hypothetical protein
MEPGAMDLGVRPRHDGPRAEAIPPTGLIAMLCRPMLVSTLRQAEILSA